MAQLIAMSPFACVAAPWDRAPRPPKNRRSESKSKPMHALETRAASMRISFVRSDEEGAKGERRCASRLANGDR